MSTCVAHATSTNLGIDAMYCVASLETIGRLAAEGFPIISHVGLIPSKNTWTGGFKAVGKTADGATVTFAGDSRTTFPSPPPDWSLAEPFSEPLPARRAARTSSDTLDKDQRPCRQGGRFETLLREGRFVVTAEANPPDSANADSYLERVRPLIGLIDAVHISDNSLSSPHMCGLATAALIEQMGMETILHMTCRDRNRIMLQADLLGAAALGVKNVLCLTGDHPSIGDHAAAQPVFDLDAVRWIDTVRHLRDEEMLLLAGPAMARGMNNKPRALRSPKTSSADWRALFPGAGERRVCASASSRSSNSRRCRASRGSTSWISPPNATVRCSRPPGSARDRTLPAEVTTGCALLSSVDGSATAASRHPGVVCSSTPATRITEPSVEA